MLAVHDGWWEIPLPSLFLLCLSAASHPLNVGLPQDSVQDHAFSSQSTSFPGGFEDLLMSSLFISPTHLSFWSQGQLSSCPWTASLRYPQMLDTHCPRIRSCYLPAALHCLTEACHHQPAAHTENLSLALTPALSPHIPVMLLPWGTSCPFHGKVLGIWEVLHKW